MSSNRGKLLFKEGWKKYLPKKSCDLKNNNIVEGTYPDMELTYDACRLDIKANSHGSVIRATIPATSENPGGKYRWPNIKK